MKSFLSSLFATVIGLALIFPLARAQDPLPSQNDGPAKQAIVEFVQATTAQGAPHFVQPEARVATFD
jgi:hypothetical protein